MGTTTTTLLSVDEFLRLPEKPGVKQELLEGVIIEMAGAASGHEIVKSNAGSELAAFCHQNPVAKVFFETQYILAEGEAYIPDVSVHLKSNPRGVARNERFRGAPEIAIEVVSSEPASVLEKKIRSYLRHGGQAVWVLYPEERVVHVYDSDGGSRVLLEHHTLESRLLPGFQLPVARLFDGI